MTSNRGDKKFIANRQQALGSLLDVFCWLRVSLQSFSLVFLRADALTQPCEKTELTLTANRTERDSDPTKFFWSKTHFPACFPKSFINQTNILSQMELVKQLLVFDGGSLLWTPSSR